MAELDPKDNAPVECPYCHRFNNPWKTHYCTVGRD
jgi:hypothetical protein